MQSLVKSFTKMSGSRDIVSDKWLAQLKLLQHAHSMMAALASACLHVGQAFTCTLPSPVLLLIWCFALNCLQVEIV